MDLSSDLVSQFVKVTKDEVETKTESTVYGTIVVSGDKTYVKLDGSELLTPIATTADTSNGDRVTVMIKDHSATVTGNLTDPSAGSEDVKKLNSDMSENFRTLNVDLTKIGDKVTEVDQLLADKVDTYYLEAELARIDEVFATKATVTDLEAGVARIESLEANSATVENLNAANAEIEDLKANTIKVQDIKGDTGEFNYLTTDSLDAAYAKIDMANVNNSWIENGVIKDAAISDAQIIDVSANKLTAGTIDASKINVTNLNADNLTVGTINGKLIGNESVTLDKLAEEVPTKEYLDSVQDNLQQQIDGAIETWTSDDIPTLNNYPAIGWKVMKEIENEDGTTTETVDEEATVKNYKKHVGDVLYVNNAANTADGFTYRFSENKDGTYSWRLIKDSEVTAALQRLLEAEANINGLKTFESNTNKWIDETDDALKTTYVTNTSLSTTLGDYVESTTFNTRVESALENSATINNITETLDIDPATGEAYKTLTNKINELKQDTDGLSSRVSTVEQTQIGGCNRYTGTKEFDGDAWVNKNLWAEETDLVDEFKVLRYDGASVTEGEDGTKAFNGVYQGVAVKAGERWTFSGYASSGDNADVAIYSDFDSTLTEPTFVNIGAVGSEYTRLSTTFKILKDGILCARFENSVTDSWVKIYGLQLERGDVATDWTPAPEDSDRKFESLSTEITQTNEAIELKATEITDEISKAGYLTVDSDAITSRVQKDELISMINQSAEQITISSDKINVDGVATFVNSNYVEPVKTIANNAASTANSAYSYASGAMQKSNYCTTNTTTIDGGKITTGSITADKIDVTNLFAQDITATGRINFYNEGDTPIGHRTNYQLYADDSGDMTIRSWGSLRIVGGWDFIMSTTAGDIDLSTPGKVGILAKGLFYEVKSGDTYEYYPYLNTYNMGDYLGSASADDYVVSEGSSGIWKYRLWNSGVAECFGAQDVSGVACNVAFGSATGWYRSSDISIDSYPVSFISAPNVLYTYNSSIIGRGAFIWPAEVESISGPARANLCRPGSNTVSGSIVIHAVGRWK